MAEEKNSKVDDTDIKDKGKLLVQWEFSEFKKYEISRLWYIVMGLIFIGLIFFSIVTQNYLFLIIIALFIVIYIIRHMRHPNTLDLIIFEDGVQIGDNSFYEWKEIKTFWIIYEPPEVKNLYFEFQTGLRPSIAITLKNQNPIEIRNLLKEYIQEDLDKENESFSDGLSRLMKL